MRVKIFNSIKYLTSTPATTLTIAKESYEPPSENDSPDFSMPYQITFQKSYRLIVARLGWSAWNLENKSLELQQPPWVLLNVQFAALCNLSPQGSVRIQVQPDDNAEPIWLKVFTSTVQKMLEHASCDVTLQSPEEQVFAQVFLLKNVFVDFNEQSSIVEDVRFK